MSKLDKWVDKAWKKAKETQAQAPEKNKELRGRLRVVNKMIRDISRMPLEQAQADDEPVNPAL